MYYTYVVRCEDNSLYTGITNDLKRRMKEHFEKDEKKCAKYTKRHNAKSIECYWKSMDRKQAAKLEYHIKNLDKNKKEELIITNNIDNILKNKVNYIDYEYEKINKNIEEYLN